MPPNVARNFRKLRAEHEAATAKANATARRVDDFARTVAALLQVPSGWTFDADALEYRRTKNNRGSCVQ